MIALAVNAPMEAVCMELDPLPAFDVQFRAHTLPAAQRALAVARRGEIEVIHMVIPNLTTDVRACSLDYKGCRMGFKPVAEPPR